MQWWCSAQGIAWSWVWRPYAGVWLVVLVIAAAVWRVVRRAPPESLGPWRRGALVAAVVVIWITLDWPVGTLGAGYLLWIHTTQFILLVMIAPPLLLLGLPRSTRDALGRRLHPMLQPLAAVAAFNVVVVVTHLPPVVDTLMVSQLGSFAIDAAWLGGGVVFWWPIVAVVPGRERAFTPPMKIGYLLLSSFAHMGVGIIFVASRFPLYGVYELAPPVGVLKLDDQQLAGGVMLVVGSLIVLAALIVLLQQWRQADAAAIARDAAAPAPMLRQPQSPA
jgi:cytochrome c oxidase assembly factor CtaG